MWSGEGAQQKRVQHCSDGGGWVMHATRRRSAKYDETGTSPFYSIIIMWTSWYDHVVISIDFFMILKPSYDRVVSTESTLACDSMMRALSSSLSLTRPGWCYAALTRRHGKHLSHGRGSTSLLTRRVKVHACESCRSHHMKVVRRRNSHDDDSVRASVYNSQDDIAHAH